MNELSFGGKTEIQAEAIFLGARLVLRGVRHIRKLGSAPLVLSAGSEGCAVLFRYGAVVFFNVNAAEQAVFLAELGPYIREAVEQPEREIDFIRLAPTENEGMEGDTITLRTFDLGRIQIVGDVLAKSVALSFYENIASKAFDRVEPLAEALEAHGKTRQRTPALLKHLGRVLRVQHMMVGRMELGEKPELLWEHSQLELLFARLEHEYELRDRLAALDKKLSLLSHTAQTALDLVQARHSLRVEWYIVALIVVEILLSSYDIFFRH